MFATNVANVGFVIPPARMLGIHQIEVWQEILHRPSTWAFMVVLVLAFPLLDYRLYAPLKSTPQIYVRNIVAEWTLVAACLWQSHQHGLRPSDLGLGLGNPLRTVAAAVALAAATGMLILAGRKQKHKPTQVNKALDKIRRLLPMSYRERRVFVAVALTAGLCEELLYRGWLLSLLAVATAVHQLRVPGTNCGIRDGPLCGALKHPV